MQKGGNMKKKMTRRQFLKWAGYTGVVLTAAPIVPKAFAKTVPTPVVATESIGEGGSGPSPSSLSSSCSSSLSSGSLSYYEYTRISPAIHTSSQSSIPVKPYWRKRRFFSMS
jgi:hypothetical protein